MARRSLGVAAALLALAMPATALAHEGSPNFLSVIQSKPQVRGLHLEVLNRDDRLALVNRTGEDVVIEGYRPGEQYARVRADGTVQVNENSEATYTNEERYGAKVPDGVRPGAAPRWRTIDRSARFEWHDHRIHWMSKTDPPLRRPKDERQQVTRWTVPIAVGGDEDAIRGELLWTPVEDGGGMPVGAVVGLLAVVVLGGAAVVVSRRRRGAGEGGTDAAGAGGREAW
ncbi:hypothetical protein [Conexibacter sp. SYSU D00693]|uniref:hypothetical protein n=1 Tax=Conexibacter sp. SYSU D00693 TaxID=2812560 RepID=UPI00196A512A|nr:hypothetical protein [Conexibacter sp. SYSU D00693]